jgi:hypothetical protein
LLESLYKACSKENCDSARQHSIGDLGEAAFAEIFGRQPMKAIGYSQQALKLAKAEPDVNNVWLYTNLAHGYLFANRFGEEKTIYLKHKNDREDSGRLVKDSVLDDFARLRKAGVTHPDMEKIETLMKSPS